MFTWLDGPGSVFKEPAVGSTNYLSAYDREGKLLRVMNPESAEAGEGKGENDIPEETRADLRPFPMNHTFVSESILSEELRNRIYEDVVVRGRSVRAVSVNFDVDMRRVGAVVRLVELEKRWRKEVSYMIYLTLHIPSPTASCVCAKAFYDEQPKSISLEDFRFPGEWLQNIQLSD